MFPRFLSEESGAVTVDWVVMTAALVGLGLASTALVSDGAESLSDDVVEVLEDPDRIRRTFLRSVTESFVADVVLAPGEQFPDLRNATSFSFQMDASLGADTDGILFEAGGRGRGTILYQHDGKLYLQAGNGRDYGAAADRGEAVWSVEDGDYSIEGSLDANTGLALYVDGELVSQASFSARSISGSNDGTVGNGNSSVAANRGGFVQGDGHSGAGELSVFVDQTTGGETGG